MILNEQAFKLKNILVFFCKKTPNKGLAQK